MIFNDRILTTLVMLALFSGACLLALGLPAKAAFMPLLIGVPGVILCAAQLVLDIVRQRKAEPTVEIAEDTEQTGDAAKSELEMFLWLIEFTVALLLFGFVVGGPLSVLLFVRLSSKDTWLNAVFAGAGTLIVLHGVFIWLLELTLFRGFVIEYFFP